MTAPNGRNVIVAGGLLAAAEAFWIARAVPAALESFGGARALLLAGVVRPLPMKMATARLLRVTTFDGAGAFRARRAPDRPAISRSAGGHAPCWMAES
jgi:hypothetical protein